MNLELDNIDEVIALDSVIENGLSHLTVSRPTLEIYREMINRGEDMPFTLKEVETQIKEGGLLEECLKGLSKKVEIILDQMENDGQAEIKPPNWKG